MFRRSARSAGPSSRRPPRERGCSGVSRAPGPARLSPRERGCSPGTLALVDGGRPRASGGVPTSASAWSTALSSSPRERGCSIERTLPDRWTNVVPARAGVFRCPLFWPASVGSRPRASGGVPRTTAARPETPPSSPRERGCSPEQPALACGPSVVPARAGVFPSGSRQAILLRSRPRASGGVPADTVAALGEHQSSPRERGCSAGLGPVHRRAEVVPARAGVFPMVVSSRTPRVGRPRASGGVPGGKDRIIPLHPSSPR